MNLLPVDLQREILSYVPLLDKLEYARCNRSLCHELMIRLRIITIRKERMEYLSSESFRKKILGLIVDPYEQLELDSEYVKTNINLPETSLVQSNLVLRTLSIYMKDLPKLLPSLIHVQHLKLEWEEQNYENIIPHISSLRKLSLFSYPHSSLTSLNDGVQLNQQLDLQSLRYLQLQGSVTDVSCLGHIYELHLSNSSALVDISCLNHNKIIVINSCSVRDYSQSFRFSRDITVNINRYAFHNGYVPTIKGINLDNLEAVQSLTIDFGNFHVPDPLSCRQSLPSSLHYFSLKRWRSRVFIPPCHSLKEISISECKDVSVQNLEKIRVIKLDRCVGITDWSQLQESKHIEISYCDGFKSGKKLRNVKKLTLTSHSLKNMVDLTSITHLKILTNVRIDSRPLFSSLTQGNNLFSSAINLQEIEFEIDSNFDASLLHSIMKSTHHKRVIIHLLYLSKDNSRSIHQLIVKEFGRFYKEEFKPPNKIVLLKRMEDEELREKRKAESKLLFSLILISLGIIPFFVYFMTQK